MGTVTVIVPGHKGLNLPIELIMVGYLVESKDCNSK